MDNDRAILKLDVAWQYNLGGDAEQDSRLSKKQQHYGADRCNWDIRTRSRYSARFRAILDVYLEIQGRPRITELSLQICAISNSRFE